METKKQMRTGNMQKHTKEVKKKAVKGGIWVLGLRILERGLSILRLIILARLLSPSDFGIMGIAMLMMGILNTFSQTGLHAALVQKKENIKEYLDTAWTVNILRGFTLTFILFLITPLASRFFNAPEASDVIKAMGFCFILQGLTNIGVVYFEREMEFHKDFVYRFSGTLTGFLTSVILAFILRNVWALVFGVLSANFVRMCVSFFVHEYKPKVNLNLFYFGQLWNFGKFVFAQSIVLFFLTQGDDAFVGKVLGTAALGLYQLAYRFSNMAATEITHVISRVTFPLYSRLQDNIKELKKSMLNALEIISFLSLPIAGTLFILAPEFVKIFLGKKWMSMITPMRILCIFGCMRSIGAAFGPVYRALAKMEIPLKINLINLFVMGILIYPLSKAFHLTGTSFAVTIGITVALTLTSIRIKQILHSSLKEIYRPVFRSMTSAFFLFLTLFIWKYYLKIEGAFEFFIPIAIGFAFHVIFRLVFFKKLNII